MSYIIWVYHYWDPFSSSPIGKPLRDDVVLWKADLVLYLKARAIKQCGNLVRTHLVTHLTDTWWLIPLSWVITPVISINLTYPIYNWGYNPLTKWDEPPSIFRKNYCNASNWGLVARMYTYFRSNSAPHMVMTGDYMPQTEWPTCVCASQLGIFIHKFTDGMGLFISYPLICRYVGDGVGFLLFEAFRSHSCGSPICSTLIVPVPTVGGIACMNPRSWGGLLKWWIPKSPWLFQHWNDLVLDHLGVTPYWWIVDCARGEALQFLPKRVRRELLEGPTAQKKWEVSAEHSKRIWCWSVWNGSAKCDSPPPPKNGGTTP